MGIRFLQLIYYYIPLLINKVQILIIVIVMSGTWDWYPVLPCKPCHIYKKSHGSYWVCIHLQSVFVVTTMVL